MSMMGVAVNTLTVLLGSALGLLFGKGIPERVTKAVMIGLGLCTVYIGIDGALSGENVLIVIAAMVLGAVVGTLLDIDRGINRLGSWVEGRFQKKQGKASVAEGFVTASLLFCVGAMTVTGSLNAGIDGDNRLLYTKATLDFFSSMMLAASLGAGVLLSGAFVLVFQGALVLLGACFGSFLSDAAVAEMTCAGSLMIVAIGLNLIGITKIKAANYLPALVFAPLLSELASLPVWHWIGSLPVVQRVLGIF